MPKISQEFCEWNLGNSDPVDVGKAYINQDQMVQIPWAFVWLSPEVFPHRLYFIKRFNLNRAHEEDFQPPKNVKVFSKSWATVYDNYLLIFLNSVDMVQSGLYQGVAQSLVIWVVLGPASCVSLRDLLEMWLSGHIPELLLQNLHFW